LRNLTTDLFLTRLFIDAGAGNAVFDRFFGGFFGTSGSGGGNDWTQTVDFSEGVFNVTYSGAVGIGSNAPLGDLWRYLDVDLTQASGGGYGPGVLRTFRQDTDMVTNLRSEVPEPTTVSFLSIGLFFIIAGRMMTKRQRGLDKS